MRRALVRGIAFVASSVVALPAEAQDPTPASPPEASKSDTAAREVLQAIAAFRERLPGELNRYDGVVFYGETMSGTRPKPEDIARGLELLDRAKAAGLFAAMPIEVRELGHDAVVWAPDKAREFLTSSALQLDPKDRRSMSCWWVTTLAAGEAGEQVLVAELGVQDVERRRLVARVLANLALHRSSVAPIERRIGAEPDAETRASLYRALASIDLPSSLPLLQRAVRDEKDDEAQAAAIWAVAEVAGFAGREFLAGAVAVGERAKQELEEGREWLAKETSADNRHGMEVVSSAEFIARFGDLHRNPAIAWLGREGFLVEDVAEAPARIDAAKKKELLELLLDSKGFGLEAVKGALFASVEAEDEAMLLRIRAAGFVSPNSQSQVRERTLKILVRHLRADR